MFGGDQLGRASTSKWHVRSWKNTREQEVVCSFRNGVIRISRIDVAETRRWRSETDSRSGNGVRFLITNGWSGEDAIKMRRRGGQNQWLSHIASLAGICCRYPRKMNWGEKTIADAVDNIAYWVDEI